MVPADPAERQTWIKARLAELGISQAEIARRLGRTRNLINLALAFPCSEAADQALAEALALDLTARDLFPERYDAEGTRLRHRRIVSYRLTTDQHSSLSAAVKQRSEAA